MKQINYDVESVRRQIIDKLVITDKEADEDYSGIVMEKAEVTDDIVDRFVLCLTKWDPWAKKVIGEEAEKIENDEYADLIVIVAYEFLYDTGMITELSCIDKCIIKLTKIHFIEGASNDYSIMS